MDKAIEVGGAALNAKVYYDDRQKTLEDAATVLNAVMNDSQALLDFVLEIDGMQMFDMVRSLVNEVNDLRNELYECRVTLLECREAATQAP